VYSNYGLGLTTWSPLASGVLTGKYNKKVIPADSRFALDNYKVSLFLDCIALFSVVSWYSMCSSTLLLTCINYLLIVHLCYFLLT